MEGIYRSGNITTVPNALASSCARIADDGAHPSIVFHGSYMLCRTRQDFGDGNSPLCKTFQSFASRFGLIPGLTSRVRRCVKHDTKTPSLVKIGAPPIVIILMGEISPLHRDGEDSRFKSSVEETFGVENYRIKFFVCVCVPVSVFQRRRRLCQTSDERDFHIE